MFGKHKSGKDGLRSACKPCEVQASTDYRNTERGAIVLRAYRERPDVQKSMRDAYGKWVRSDAGKETKKAVEARSPIQKRARAQLHHAVRTGRIIPWPACAVPECSARPEAHHPDYSTPLNVVWLCPAHHKQTHALVRERIAA